jgi:hypothetical protein
VGGAPLGGLGFRQIGAYGEVMDRKVSFCVYVDGPQGRRWKAGSSSWMHRPYREHFVTLDEARRHCPPDGGYVYCTWKDRLKDRLHRFAVRFGARP